MSDAEDNTYGPLNGGGMADLHLLITLLAIRWKSREPSFWEVTDSFVLVAYASLAAPKTLLQRLLARFKFRFRGFILFVQIKKKNDFYELWQQHKLLKTMEMSEVWSDTYDEWYIDQYQPGPTNKIHYLKDILLCNISEMISKTISISTRIVISYAMKRGILSEFLYGGKAVVEQILVSEEMNKSKRAGLWES